MTSAGRPSRRLPANLVLATAAVLATLLALEIGLVIVGYDPVGELLRSNDGRGRDALLRPSPNPDLRYEHIPDARTFAWGTPVTINSHGMRDREYTREKAAGTARVAVLGDSKTFGNYLPIEQVYTEVLERRLQEAGYAAEILNFGVGGYDTVQEVALLEQRVLDFAPDMVVVGYCMNDIGIVSANLRHIRNAQRFSSLIYRSRLAQLVVRQWDRIGAARELEAANTLETFARDFAGRIDPVDDASALALVERLAGSLAGGERGHATLGWYAEVERVGRLRHTFRRLSDIGREHDIEVTLLVFPYLTPPTEAERIAYEIVRGEADRQGLGVVELVGRFVDHGIEGLRRAPHDLIHPGPEGHVLVAETLFDRLAPALERFVRAADATAR